LGHYKLFNLAEPNRNLLPFDGTVNYFGQIFTQNECLEYFKAIFDKIPWQQDEVIIFGKKIITARKIAWFSEDNLPYTYSNSTKNSSIFTPDLLAIKTKIELLSGEKYNACLLNLYHNGNEGMGWHADNEKEIATDSAIASVSFGEERKFVFKHKSTSETISLSLENGSLLIMKNETQRYWLHSLPKTTKINGPRINLTFRKML
jgi:alkylated DNA repair dioxygenase AlkB